MLCIFISLLKTDGSCNTRSVRKRVDAALYSGLISLMRCHFPNNSYSATIIFTTPCSAVTCRENKLIRRVKPGLVSMCSSEKPCSCTKIPSEHLSAELP